MRGRSNIYKQFMVCKRYIQTHAPFPSHTITLITFTVPSIEVNAIRDLGFGSVSREDFVPKLQHKKSEAV